MPVEDKVLKEALALTPVRRAALINKLLASLDASDAQIEDAWAKEVESRIDAYERGEIKAVTLDEVLERYR